MVYRHAEGELRRLRPAAGGNERAARLLLRKGEANVEGDGDAGAPGGVRRGVVLQPRWEENEEAGQRGHPHVDDELSAKNG